MVENVRVEAWACRTNIEAPAYSWFLRLGRWFVELNFGREGRRQR